MRLKELKLMAGTIVVESKLTNDAKIQLLKFVKEASYFQTVALVLGDGIVSESKLNHDTLVERFNTEFDQGVLNEFIDEDTNELLEDLIFIAEAVILKSGLEESEYNELLEYVKTEASESELMSFILDGEMVKLDEQSMDVLVDRFIIYEGAVGTAAKFVGKKASGAGKFVKKGAKGAASIPGKIADKARAAKFDMQFKSRAKKIKKSADKVKKANNPSFEKIVRSAEPSKISKAKRSIGDAAKKIKTDVNQARIKASNAGFSKKQLGAAAKKHKKKIAVGAGIAAAGGAGYAARRA